MTMHAGVNDCTEFRSALEEALEGRPSPSGLARLGWHEHLIGCGACRSLLEAEEALEGLLASLPEPRLPAAVARRVVRRLRVLSSDARLDRLLDLDAEPAAPPGLARRVLAGITERREARLEGLLAEAGEAPVPPGLPGRVLAAVEASRVTPLPRRRLRVLRSPLLARAAAALVVAGLVAAVWQLGKQPARPADDELAQAPPLERSGATGGSVEPGAEPDPGLLDALFVLENWELLETLDPVALDTVTVFEPADELLFELEELAAAEGSDSDR